MAIEYLLVTFPEQRAVLADGEGVGYLNLDTFRLALYANDLRRGQNALRKVDYLYFLDGGLADNLAIHGLLETISSPYAAPIIAGPSSDLPPSSTILDAVNAGRIKKLAVIVINARAAAANTISQTASRPGIVGMVESLTSVPINATTAAVSSQMDVLLSQLKAASAGGTGDPQFAGLQIYAIQVNVDQLRVSDPVQRELRDKANAIPTLWSISKENREVLEQAGTLLLHQHPCFQRLLIDMNIEADFIDPAFARAGCRQTTD